MVCFLDLILHVFFLFMQIYLGCAVMRSVQLVVRFDPLILVPTIEETVVCTSFASPKVERYTDFTRCIVFRGSDLIRRLRSAMPLRMFLLQAP